MTEELLSGRVAIVTGASSGLGRAIAIGLANAGLRVSMVGRNQADLEEVASTLGHVPHAPRTYCADIRVEGAIETVVDDTVNAWGGLHVFVNNAGLSHEGGIVQGERGHWQEMVDLNVVALLAGAKAAVQAMRDTGSHGHIVNIGSIGARVPNGGAYGATKAAVDMITRSLRMELEDEPIRVVQILPGAFMTNFGRYFPAAVVNRLLAAMGETRVHSDGEKLPVEVLERIQSKASTIFGNPSAIADALIFAISQPISVNVSEIVIQPAKSDWRAAIAGP